jgi:hypothetical protein
MVVSKDILSALVRDTAVNASVACRIREGQRKHPYLVRKQVVSEFVTKHKTKPAADEWWTSQFIEA